MAAKGETPVAVSSRNSSLWTNLDEANYIGVDHLD